MAVGGVLAGGRAVGVGPSAGWFGAVVRRSVGWMMVWWLRGERVVWCCTAAAMVGGLVVLSEGSGGVDVKREENFTSITSLRNH
jgi:hypothetical protein